MIKVVDLRLPAIDSSQTCLTFHWAASTYVVTDNIKQHYHFILGKEGRLYLGVPVGLNCPKVRKGYAAHVRMANTNNIGISAAAMHTASESGSRAGHYGKYPMTELQVEGMCRVAALICQRYNIDPTPQRVLGHEEWDSVKHKPQDRWDVNCIPHKDIRPHRNPDGTYDSTNWMRHRVREIMQSL